jgi:integrase
MSVQRAVLGDGTVSWRVRWRDGGRGSRMNSRSFTRKADAAAFDEEVRRRRRLGEMATVVAAQDTLDHYVAETWAKTHAVTLARSTARTYAGLYDLHIPPYLGQLKLVELTPEVIARWQAERLAAGAGRSSIHKTLTLLGGILQRAMESGRISRNPVRLVRKVKRPAKKEVRPLAPATVEALRVACGPRDATLISALAYAGLRPQEAVALRWGDIRERTILIERAVSLGGEADTKTTAHRTVRLLAPLREDLLAWKLRSGRPRDTSPVFPGPEGRSWSKTSYDNWRGRNFDRAMERAGVEGSTPYALRHSFASLLLHEGRSVIYVARQLGHDARLTLGTYGHVIDELDGAPQIPAEDAIWAARGTRCAIGVPSPEGEEPDADEAGA